MTQQQANDTFQKPAYDISLRYAAVLNTMLLTAFYAPLLPIGLLWGLVGLSGLYWAEKWVLIKNSSVPHNMSNQLSLAMIEILEYFLPVYCGANLIFQYLIVTAKPTDDTLSADDIITFVHQSSKYAVFGVLVGIVHCFLPMEDINMFFFRSKPAELTKLDYDTALRQDFETDYRRENPATKEEARSNPLDY